jgi:hypothetical protein
MMAERQIVFYECQDFPEADPFDLATALTDLNSLEDAEWRQIDGDDQLAVIVDREAKGKKPAHLRLLRIRPDAPYRLTATRKLSPVEIEEDENITEFTWAAIWPDGFMGAVSSRDAPNHKKLSDYFFATSEQATHIVNLFRPDMVERLKELTDNGLRQVQVKVRTSQFQQKEFDEKRTGFRQFWRAGDGTDAATIGIDLSVGRSGPDAILAKEIGSGVTYLAEHIEAVESLHVKGYNDNGEIETINLKQERLKQPIEITPATTNKDVYANIRRARRDLEKEIGALGNATRGS